MMMMRRFFVIALKSQAYGVQITDSARKAVSNHSPFQADTSSAAKASPPDRIFLMREQDKTTSAWEKNTVRTKCTQEPKLGHAASTKHTSSDINYYQVFFLRETCVLAQWKWGRGGELPYISLYKRTAHDSGEATFLPPDDDLETE